MEEILPTIKEDNSTISSKKSLTSYLIPSNNKEFLVQHKTDLDLINAKKNIIKENNPSKVIFIIISSILMSISIYFPNYIYYLYKDKFNTNIFLLFHSLTIIIGLSIITYIYEKTNILSTLNYLEHKRWFFLRSNLNFIGILFYILSLKFFRCITIQITIISLISVLFLIGVYFYKNGNISQNLIFGIFCILTGDSLVLYNELKYVNNNGIYYNTIGLIFVIISLSSFSSIKIINRKYLNLDNYNLVIHMSYNNIVICIYCSLFLPVSYFKGININFIFIILSALSGLIFAVGIFILVLVFKKKQSGESYINTISIPGKPKLERNLCVIYNLNIFYVFILCFCFDSEEMFFKDLVAAIIIFLFKIFNGDKEFKDIPCFFN
jgi:hypothetical protein